MRYQSGSICFFKFLPVCVFLCGSVAKIKTKCAIKETRVCSFCKILGSGRLERLSGLAILQFICYFIWDLYMAQIAEWRETAGGTAFQRRLAGGFHPAEQKWTHNHLITDRAMSSGGNNELKCYFHIYPQPTRETTISGRFMGRFGCYPVRSPCAWMAKEGIGSQKGKLDEQAGIGAFVGWG